MPVQACSLDGQPGYQYGEGGKCFTYDATDEVGRRAAKRRAFLQGAAIAARTGQITKSDPGMGDVHVDTALGHAKPTPRKRGRGRSLVKAVLDRLTGKAAPTPTPPTGVTPADVVKAIRFDVLKQNDDLQVVYGVVLQPDIEDAQGDVVAAGEIALACWRFLADYRIGQSKLRLQHRSDLADKQAVLVENYTAPVDFELGGKMVKAGSWVQAWHVADPKVWARIKDGSYTGFSIGASVRVA